MHWKRFHLATDPRVMTWYGSPATGDGMKIEMTSYGSVVSGVRCLPGGPGCQDTGRRRRKGGNGSQDSGQLQERVKLSICPPRHPARNQVLAVSRPVTTISTYLAAGCTSITTIAGGPVIGPAITTTGPGFRIDMFGLHVAASFAAVIGITCPRGEAFCLHPFDFISRSPGYPTIGTRRVA